MKSEYKLDENIARQLEEAYSKKDALLSTFASKDSDCIRKENYTYKIFRRQYIRDCEAVINLQLFNRYAGKTQVFSLTGNDDISTRAYHVQLVSRIARTIGMALGLNCDLIEAIALAHDLGHCPFGHKGEKILDKIAQKHGYRFMHHIQSARYLNNIVGVKDGANISLQVIDGVLCHNGEKVLDKYAPNENSCKSFDDIQSKLESAYKGQLNDDRLFASTLEGCLVRIADVIAYIGKDRQDAEKLGYVPHENYKENILGTYNHQIISSLSVDIINNSYGKNYIAMSDKTYEALQGIFKDNYEEIYLSDHSKVDGYSDGELENIMSSVFETFYNDIKGDQKLVNKYYRPYIYPRKEAVDRYFEENKDYPERVATDIVASMTDGYLIRFYNKL